MLVGSIVLNVILIYLFSFLLDRCYIDRIEKVCSTWNASTMMDKGLFTQVDDEMRYVAVDIKKLADIEDNRNKLEKQLAEESNDFSIISTDTGREYQIIETEQNVSPYPQPKLSLSNQGSSIKKNIELQYFFPSKPLKIPFRHQNHQHKTSITPNQRDLRE
jgi:hypothetical protein